MKLLDYYLALSPPSWQPGDGQGNGVKFPPSHTVLDSNPHASSKTPEPDAAMWSVVVALFPLSYWLGFCDGLSSSEQWLICKIVLSKQLITRKLHAQSILLHFMTWIVHRWLLLKLKHFCTQTLKLGTYLSKSKKYNLFENPIYCFTFTVTFPIEVEQYEQN